MIYIKNNTESTQVYVNQSVNAGEYVLLQLLPENSDWDSFDDLVTAVEAGDAIASRSADESGHYADLELAIRDLTFTKNKQLTGIASV